MSDQELVDKHISETCESPIENALVRALLRTRREQIMMCANRLDIKKELLGQNKISIGMTLQAKVGRYRLDFLLGLRVLDSIKWLVVECDGHDWHDRTKEQAAADRSRDRELQTDGLDVFRFTGSEIWNDSEFCAREVFDWIDAMRAAQ